MSTLELYLKAISKPNFFKITLFQESRKTPQKTKMKEKHETFLAAKLVKLSF